MRNSFETNPGCQFRIVHLALVISLIAIVLATLVPLARQAREGARRSACSGNLHQLALALVNYHDTYHSFPPAHYTDASGKPSHSWRALVLPFMEQHSIYSRYSFDEPWNGPNNSMLHKERISLYHCPSAHGSQFHTNYVAVTGSRVWPKCGTFSLKNGPPASQTIMIVEISNSDIHWMEPRDLSLDELDKWLDPSSKPRFFGNHINGGWVVSPERRVEFLTREEVINQLKALAIESNLEPAASKTQQ